MVAFSALSSFAAREALVQARRAESFLDLARASERISSYGDVLQHALHLSGIRRSFLLLTRRRSQAFGGILFSGEEGGPFPRGAYSLVRDPKGKTA